MFPAPSAVCLMNVKIWRILDEVGGGFLKTIRSVVNAEINARAYCICSYIWKKHEIIGLLKVFPSAHIWAVLEVFTYIFNTKLLCASIVL